MMQVSKKAKTTVRKSKAVTRRKRSRQALLPDVVQKWLSSRGWEARAHQVRLIEQGRARQPTLLIAPTGAGKTLAGFLPSLSDLIDPIEPAERKGAGLHTLYLSPLKALAVDVARNLTTPLEEMGLKIRVETRSGDTSAHKRQRQRTRPPDILLTTPEQLALLLSNEDAAYLFADLKTIVLDELHALTATKRGDLLSLGLARLRKLAPDVLCIGLSATVARPSELRAYLMEQVEPETTIQMADLVEVAGGVAPEIKILETEEALPWSGHTSRYAVPDLYTQIKAHRLTLLFVNTRSQAELLFQELWRINDDDLPIGLHHGSLD
ncbi:MAG: DEAD/DEAH box helicase, partial [Pseudomonadota bacterium]